MSRSSLAQAMRTGRSKEGSAFGRRAGCGRPGGCAGARGGSSPPPAARSPPVGARRGCDARPSAGVVCEARRSAPPAQARSAPVRSADSGSEARARRRPPPGTGAGSGRSSPARSRGQLQLLHRHHLQGHACLPLRSLPLAGARLGTGSAGTAVSQISRERLRCVENDLSQMSRVLTTSRVSFLMCPLLLCQAASGSSIAASALSAR
jgi:hypothetical protein